MADDAPEPSKNVVGSADQEPDSPEAARQRLVDNEGGELPQKQPPEPTRLDDQSEDVAEDSLGADPYEPAPSDGGQGRQDNAPSELSGDLADQLLGLQRTRDAQRNRETRPPENEAVTFRSVTVAEIYTGQAIDSLTTRLAKINWVNLDVPIVDEITEARKGYQYAGGVFWLVSDETRNQRLSRRGMTSLPSGVDRIYGRYYVAGPSIVALVLTFVLVDDLAKRLDTAVREDAESRFDRVGPRRGTFLGVDAVKRERVRNIREEVTQRCLTWLKNEMAGTLSGSTEGLGPPTCALLSLVAGTPFETQGKYMSPLDLNMTYSAQKFAHLSSLCLTRPIMRTRDNEFLAAFNEPAALGGDWLPGLEAAPEHFHEAISSLMIIEGIYAVLLSFEPQMRDIRADLSQLDIDKPAGSRVVALRNRLLRMSREISIINNDVTVLIDDAVVIWRELSPLASVQHGAASTPPDDTAEVKRRQLRAVMDSLQAQEAGLRDLILITSQSINETRSIALAKQLTWLTYVLAALTAGLLVLAAVQLVNPPSVTVDVTPTPQVISPSPYHNSRPSSAPSQPKSSTHAVKQSG